MSWRSVGKDNADLVQQLEGRQHYNTSKKIFVVLGHVPSSSPITTTKKKPQLIVISQFTFFYFDSDNGIIKNPIVKESMTATDRKFYCKKTPYVDAPQSIGYSVTISAPHMVL